MTSLVLNQYCPYPVTARVCANFGESQLIEMGQNSAMSQAVNKTGKRCVFSGAPGERGIGLKEMRQTVRDFSKILDETGKLGAYAHKAANILCRMRNRKLFDCAYLIRITSDTRSINYMAGDLEFLPAEMTF